MGKEHQKYARGRTGEKLYSILNELIDISEDQQKKHKAKHFYDNLSWAKEFCTIQFKTARQSGHTYALIEVAITRFESPAIVTPRSIMNRHIEESIKKQRNQYQTGVPILTTIDSLDRLRGVGKIDAVLVDCSFMVSDNKKEEIYNIFSEKTQDKPFFFIFVE